jgi:hypothetical protein
MNTYLRYYSCDTNEYNGLTMKSLLRKLVRFTLRWPLVGLPFVMAWSFISLESDVWIGCIAILRCWRLCLSPVGDGNNPRGGHKYAFSFRLANTLAPRGSSLFSLLVSSLFRSCELASSLFQLCVLCWARMRPLLVGVQGIPWSQDDLYLISKLILLAPRGSLLFAV